MKLIVRAAILALTTIAGSHATAVFAQDKDLKVGAIYMDAQGFYAGVRKGIQKGANDAGRKLDVVETNAQGDASKESSFIDTLISSGVQAIIVSPVSADGSSRAIRRAHDAGIPVVCYNTCLNDADMKEYISAYAVGDPYDFGHKLGDAAANISLPQKIDAPKIAVLNCEFVEVCVTRRKGFEEALKAKVAGAADRREPGGRDARQGCLGRRNHADVQPRDQRLLRRGRWRNAGCYACREEPG
jgi:ABC-type sugar transport system substrate-binding protein